MDREVATILDVSFACLPAFLGFDEVVSVPPASLVEKLLALLSFRVKAEHGHALIVPVLARPSLVYGLHAGILGVLATLLFALLRCVEKASLVSTAPVTEAFAARFVWIEPVHDEVSSADVFFGNDCTVTKFEV